MPKRPSPGKCVHCLKNFDSLTWDHVLPESWYPELRNGLEKWQVPSCESCNKKLGKIEEDLLIKLGLCLDPHDFRSLGIPDKILRALDPSFGKNDRDRKYRLAKRDKVIKGIKVFQNLPQLGIFPNFGPLPDQEYCGYPTVMLEEDEIKLFVEKIVRGIVYIADESYIDERYDIEHYVIEEQKVTELIRIVEPPTRIFDRRPGLLVKQSLVENEKVAGIYFIEIWERFRMYVSVAPKNLMTNFFGD